MRTLIAALMSLWLTGCGLLQPAQQPIVRPVGMTALPSEGLELRFGLKLRIQNPRDRAIEFDGVAISLDLNNQGLASGVSAQTGTVDRFGESVIEVPVSVSALTAIRQAIAQFGQEKGATVNLDIPYTLSGRLSSTGFNDVVFNSTGKLSDFNRASDGSPAAK